MPKQGGPDEEKLKKVPESAADKNGKQIAVGDRVKVIDLMAMSAGATGEKAVKEVEIERFKTEYNGATDSHYVEAVFKDGTSAPVDELEKIEK